MTDQKFNMKSNQSEMENAVAKRQEETFSDKMLARLDYMSNNNQIHFPDNYSPQNAIASAWIKLQDMTTKIKGQEYPVLEACTSRSIANALLDMVIQGLSIAKKQGYLVPFKDELGFMRSYFGTMTVAKRIEGIKDVFAQCVYPSEEFEYEIVQGNYVVTKHKPQPIDKIGTEDFIGAYAAVVHDDGSIRYEVMSRQQIIAAWHMGNAFSDRYPNGSKAHQEFPDQMAKRTVINRACKYDVNSSDDSDLLIESFNRSTEYEYKEAEVVSEETKPAQLLEMPSDNIPQKESSDKPSEEEMQEIIRQEINESQGDFSADEEAPDWA